jgi:hypothetical protein
LGVLGLNPSQDTSSWTVSELGTFSKHLLAVILFYNFVIHIGREMHISFIFSVLTFRPTLVHTPDFAIDSKKSKVK